MTNQGELFRRQHTPKFVERADPNTRLEMYEKTVRRLQPKRHELAVVCSRIDRHVNHQLGDQAFQTSDMSILTEYSGLDKPAAERLTSIAKWYHQTAQARLDQERKLKASLEVVNESNLGRTAYQLIMESKQAQHIQPAGEVYLLSHPLAFVMLVVDAGDYDRLTDTPDSGGIFYPYSHLGGEQQWSGGTFQEVPLVIVRHLSDKTPTQRELRRLIKNNSLVVHELAHALHDKALQMFADTESTWSIYLDPEDQTKEREQRDVKDELLAYIKQGRSDISKILNKPLYEQLFRTFDDRERARVHDYVSMIDTVLNKFDTLLQEIPLQQRRDLIYYQLLDVPLGLMFDQLATMLAYYRDVMNNDMDQQTLPAGRRLPEQAFMGELQDLYTKAISSRSRFAELQATKQSSNNVLSTHPARRSELYRAYNDTVIAEAGLLGATQQYLPAYATDIKFLPDVARDPRARSVVTALVNQAQQVKPKLLNEQFARLLSGLDVIGAGPERTELLDPVIAEWTKAGVAMDGLVIDSCNDETGQFSYKFRLTLPPQSGKPTVRVKLKLHFTVGPETIASAQSKFDRESA